MARLNFVLCTVHICLCPPPPAALVQRWRHTLFVFISRSTSTPHILSEWEYYMYRIPYWVCRHYIYSNSQERRGCVLHIIERHVGYFCVVKQIWPSILFIPYFRFLFLFDLHFILNVISSSSTLFISAFLFFVCVWGICSSVILLLLSWLNIFVHICVHQPDLHKIKKNISRPREHYYLFYFFSARCKDFFYFHLSPLFILLLFFYEPGWAYNRCL